MLKRGLHIVLVLLLLVSTSGITISRHYCGDNLRAVSVMTQPDACCDTEGCCHNETEVFQVSDDYSVTLLNIDFEQEDVPAPSIIALNLSFEAFLSGENIYSDLPSPPGNIKRLATLQTFIL